MMIMPAGLLSKKREQTRAQKREKPDATSHAASGLSPEWELSFRLCFQHFAATVKTSGTDVVAEVNFAGGGLHCDSWHNQGVVRAVHAALGGRFFVLLNCHGRLLVICTAQYAAR
jgi:hypothetical protein